MSTLARLQRLFDDDGRCMILSFDHGLFGEGSWLDGLRALPDILRTHAAEMPDGMTLPTGGARLLQSLPGRRKPALLLRADTSNAYLASHPDAQYDLGLRDVVERALRLDAVCVVQSFLTFPGQAALTRDCIANVDRLRAECDRYAMPLMVELLAMTDNAGVPLVETGEAIIAPLVRQAMELGADVIKADPTVPSTDFARLVEVAAGVPVIASGGIKAPDAEVLTRTAELLEAGARGIAYGRNVLWAEHPTRMTRALCDLVHGRVTVDEAIDIARRA
ncbi:MAG: aldolase [Gammaproteobacteria bacterium]|nr:aldolase [Gammaproteobacteria bacterium]